ncbi:tetratricopeptide repeat protein [Donghicola mangrovi]|uniref:Tetratricopeptide repeat protein n=1 Tax=Donghicola mangrovi TaxID=2729614 RepID=A0A850QDN3_9RHOB|nr:tetratricopeptide repeat protein [Donghicola mangrovi]NVO24259.1 tetratricopeptide repeat protein [Donghicola mangrovi]
MVRWATGILLMTSLAACMGPSDQLPDNPYAPATDYSAEPVDQILVGERLMDAGENELALQAFTRAAATQGMTAVVLSSLGSANLRLGRLGQAETLLRRAVAEDENSPAAWNNLGVVLMEAGRTPEAVQVFRKAYALSNGDSDEIRDNLRLALAKFENSQYVEEENTYKLVRQGTGEYLLKTTPE